MSNLKKLLLLFLFFPIFLLGYINSSNAQSTYDDDTFIILFDNNTSANKIELFRQEFNATEIWISPYAGIRFWKINFFPFTLSSTGQKINDINEGVKAANERPSVDGVGFNYKTTIPSFNKGTRIDGGNNINCKPFTINTNDLGAVPNQYFKIAIFDTGISEFGDSSIYYNNLFEGLYIGKDFVNNDAIPNDDHGHGTHIAGIISSLNDDISLNPFEYHIYKTHDQNGEGYLSDIILALDEAIIQQVDMINMSFSYAKRYDLASTSIDPFEYQINLAKNNGILIMASAGNEHHNNDGDIRYYPASFRNKNIIAVASTDCMNELSKFSNYGQTTVDVAILGENIKGPDMSGHTAIKSGTSQACAFTTKVAMILAQESGYMNWENIKCRILNGSILSNFQIQQLLLKGIINLPNSLALNPCFPNQFPALNLKTTVLKTVSFNNPVSQEIYLYYTAKDDFLLDLNLFDLSGKQIISYLGINKEKTTISVSTLPAGIYILKIKDRLSGKELIEKIIKQ